MESIKIGRKEYEIKKGDYVFFNGVCYMFCSGDGRTLMIRGWDRFSYLTMPKSLLKKIPFDKMRKVETGNKEKRNLYIKWYFN